MSRLSDLLRQVEQLGGAQLAADLTNEFQALSGRRAFGLNFERHKPETVELPGRPVRRGDKVRILPPRDGSTSASDSRLWLVAQIARDGDSRLAVLQELSMSDGAEAESRVIDCLDLVVVAEFRDPIYPGLVSTGTVERGGDRPFHAVISAENFHALQTLLYTHEAKIDAIYIDPPYNTGARDWKYNNDYVDADDAYRHSKWLAFMQRRLELAKRLLNPADSVLIVTIDEKEYRRLGLLLEQVFSEARIQMVSSVINRKGVVRANEFTRTNEFIYVVMFGSSRLMPNRRATTEAVRWASLRRTDIDSRRGAPKGGQGQFYPIYVNRETGSIDAVGEPLRVGGC